MKDIKDLLKKYCHEYKWFYLISRTSKFWVMETRYVIYDLSFRRLYDWKFHSIYESEKFIDQNYKLLSLVSKSSPIFSDKYNSEYFNWWYNYYGELIHKSWS